MTSLKRVSFVSHFTEDYAANTNPAHNLTIKIPDMPVLNIGNKENPMYMPAEYCSVLPGQSSMKKLSPDQTATMIRFACRKPFLNAKSITEDGPDVLGLLPGSNSVLVGYRRLTK